IRFASYLYDDAGNLVSWTDADGVVVRYAYDPLHRLTALRYANGLTYRWVYDSHGRCVETWGSREEGGADPSLDEGLSPFLSDGKTRAKGLHHVKITYTDDGFREVATTTEVQSFSISDLGSTKRAVGNGGVTTRTFDANGHVVTHTDRNEATTT